MGAAAAGGIIPPDVFAAAHSAARAKAWVATIAAAAVLLGGGYGLSKAGFLGSKGSASGSDLFAIAKPSSPILAEKGDSGPPMLATGDSSVTMPQDVLDWLNHLKAVEEKKRDLTESQKHEVETFSGQALATNGLMDVTGVNDLSDPDSTSTQPPVVNQFQKLITHLKQQWFDLSQFLKSKPAPAECQEIEAAYDQGLTQMGLQMSDLAGIPQEASDEAATDQGAARDHGTAAVNDIGSNHTKVIDDQFQTALNGVNGICAKYHTKPWFGIDVHGDNKNTLEGGP